ncbi:MAG: hypothetical protein HY726_15235 [Candidatus Rokubacteria bacterium]|nr:hypothetical protein [Candidatus Rokubacteria bacterium]
MVALSAGAALSLPYVVGFIAQKFLDYWSLIENERVFLISLEIAVAILLILFFHYVWRSWEDRKLARMARGARLAYFPSSRRLLARRRVKNLKDTQGLRRDVMLIGSTGFRTFMDPRGDLHNVIQNCRTARILLLNPHSEGASVRAKSIPDPDITPESLTRQITRTVDFLKGLKAIQKDVKLKLYPEAPFLKLAVLGDYAWVQHYHAGLDVQAMPEYMFEHDQNPGSLYAIVYQYFLTMWKDAAIPEYDLETDELIYRDATGNEARREKFQKAPLEVSEWPEPEADIPA